MSQLWTILGADGAVLCPAYSTPSADAHPKDNGWPWVTGQTAARIAAPPDPAVQVWSGSAWAEDPARVEALLLAQVKADNETRVRGVYTTNFGKQKKYARKQQEVLDFRALAAVLNPLTAALSSFIAGFNAMTIAQRAKKFRFAMAQAALRGVTVDVIIGEFEAAIETKEQQVANWEAVELEAVRAIKAAPTAAAKRAAYAAINWNWSAS